MNNINKKIQGIIFDNLASDQGWYYLVLRIFSIHGNLVVYFSDLWSSNILVLTFGFSPHQRSCDYKHITLNKPNRQSSPQFY